MALLLIGLALFIGVHSIAIASPAGRDALAARLGPGAFQAVFAVVAIVGLVLIVQGYGAARQAPTFVYVPPPWLRYVAVVLLIPVFVMAAAAYLPGRIQAALKHPLLAAVKLWALTHLLVNGTVADLVLFGSLLVWAVAERISLKRHPRTRGVTRGAPSPYNDLTALGVGIGLYVLFVLGLHEWLFGVDVPPYGVWS